MKLQIKTHNKKTLVVDIDATETVFQLKKELAMYPDIDVQPELQKLTYAGTIMDDDEALTTYKLDGRKLINIEVLKTPLPKIVKPIPKEEEPPKKDKEEVKVVEKKSSEDEPSPSSSKANAKIEELVTNISSMGYPEEDVRRAMNASFNNPERAVQYLIDGIPTPPCNDSRYTDTDQTMNPMDIFLNDDRITLLRQRLHHDPDSLAKFIIKLGDEDPDMLSLISDNQSDFFGMLVEQESMDSSDDEDGVEVEELIGDLNEEDFNEFDKIMQDDDEGQGDVAS